MSSRFRIDRKKVLYFSRFFLHNENMAKSKKSTESEDLSPILKIFFAVLLIVLPLIAFVLGMQYQSVVEKAYPTELETDY